MSKAARHQNSLDVNCDVLLYNHWIELTMAIRLAATTKRCFEVNDIQIASCRVVNEHQLNQIYVELNKVLNTNKNLKTESM